MEIFRWRNAKILKPVNRRNITLAPGNKILVRWAENLDDNGELVTRYTTPIRSVDMMTVYCKDGNATMRQVVEAAVANAGKKFDLGRGTITLEDVPYVKENFDKKLPALGIELGPAMVLKSEYLTYATLYADEFCVLDE